MNWACATERDDHSELFHRIIVNHSALFRGQELGRKIQEVKESEAKSELTLVREDKYGLVYELNLEENREARIEYYINERNHANPDELVSIICNLKLKGQVEAVNLYREMEQYLTQTHGVPDGTFGKKSWESNRERKGRTNVQLDLHPGKEGITLNFYRPKEFYGK